MAPRASWLIRHIISALPWQTFWFGGVFHWNLLTLAGIPPIRTAFWLNFVKYRCPKITYKGGTPQCTCEDPCSDAKYGRNIHLVLKDNPRLFNNPPRGSAEWKLEYNARTSAERCNKREKISLSKPLNFISNTIMNHVWRNVYKSAPFFSIYYLSCSFWIIFTFQISSDRWTLVGRLKILRAYYIIIIYISPALRN